MVVGLWRRGDKVGLGWLGLTGRGINYKVVELAPPDVAQKLADHRVLLRASPYDRILFPFEQKADAHACEAGLAPVGIHWDPPVAALMYRVTVEAKHPWYRGTSEIDIEDSDACRRRGCTKGKDELGRDGRLAYSTFSRADDDNVFDAA